MPHAPQGSQPEQEFVVTLEYNGKRLTTTAIAPSLGQAQELARYSYCRDNKIPSNRWTEVRIIEKRKG
jgi:hypothetical protein